MIIFIIVLCHDAWMFYTILWCILWPPCLRDTVCPAAEGGHVLWTVIHCWCRLLACWGSTRSREAPVQSADCAKTLLASHTVAKTAAEAAATLVLARLMAEWALPCPAIPLLPPHWRACWNWAGWHYRAQPDHTVKRDYAVNRHAHKHAVAEKALLPAWIKTAKQRFAFLPSKNVLLKQRVLLPLCRWIGINVHVY